jgi:hypothetical protein
MASALVSELKKKSDAAAANLASQLQDMEQYLDKSDAPGEWTTRQVLCHLLAEPDWRPVATLKSFATSCPSPKPHPTETVDRRGG